MNLNISFLLGCSVSARGGRPATTISHPSHILLIFSSEPPRNPRPVLSVKKSHIGRTRISSCLRRENEENVARTRNCCGCSSSPRLALILGFISQWMMRWIKRCNRCCNFNLFWIATCLNLDPTLPTLKLKQGRNCLCIIKPWVLYPVLLSFEHMSENHDVNLCRRIMMWTYVGEPWCEPMSENYHVNLCRRTMMWTYVGRTMMWTYVGELWCEPMSENHDGNN